MIEGAILVVELGLFLLLLFKVWRVQSKKEDESTGFFAYRADKLPPLAKGKQSKPFGGPPHA